MFVLALVLALLVGVSLGLLGGGGSILTVPILRYALGLEAHTAIAGSLVVVGLTSLAALVTHARAGRVRWLTGALFGAASMVGAFLAGKVSAFIPAAVLLIGFALMMFATAIAMLRGRRDRSGGGSPGKVEASAKRVGLVLAEGLAVGAVTGLVGAGGGFLVVPALVLLGGLPMDVAVGTSLVVIALKSAAALAGYASNPELTLPWDIILPMSAVAIGGSVVGGRLTARVPPEALRRGFAWFVIGMGLFVLGMEVPKALGGAPSALLALGAAGVLTALAFTVARRAQTPGVQVARKSPLA
jgi:uncharacterized membrane protein YfcA